MICWSCKEPVGGPVCVGCGAVQPPPAAPDWFEILGLERRFHVEVPAMEERWRARARQVHPDRFTRKSAVERRMALQWTAALNEARRVLKDPLVRARYLATGEVKPGEKGPALDPEFMQEMFAWREADEDAPGSLVEHARAREAELRAELDAIFTAWEEGRGDLHAVDDRLARIKYVAGLLPKDPHAQHRD